MSINTKLDSSALLMADLLFPEYADSKIYELSEEFECIYPPRNLPVGAAVTRLGPSPTGFIHLGNLYTAFMNQKLAEETGGVFILRVEDTDSKREVDGAVESLITSLAHFGINFTEGVAYDLDANVISETGDYGPYYQSRRINIYHAYVRQLVAEGKAYPCFLTEDEISEIRTKQEESKLTPGIYAEYAKYRDISALDAEAHIKAGEPYVVRLRSEGISESGRMVTIVDGIRGELSFPENIMDVVLLKSDGIPTYHFAHAVDDHLMRTTHVIRGEEWLSSLPIHVALFDALGFELPTYCHSTVLMKMDGDKKRKLSKRHDPELSLEYYCELGYHPAAISEYLMTIINSNFEEWRAENPDAPLSNFQMTTEKMSVSGILFDLDKLADVSKETIVRMPASKIADFLIEWSRLFKPEFYREIAQTNDRDYLEAVLDIGRAGEKPRKDLAYAAQIAEHISYMYDAEYEAAVSENIPVNVQPEDAKQILAAYLETYNHSDDRETWFAKIRELGEKLGYAPKPKEYKKNPDLYKGHVGDVSTVIRLALTKRSNSPDIYEIQQLLGEERVRSRIWSNRVIVAHDPQSREL